MIPVCQDLPVLPDKWENRRDHLRQRSREETRVTREFQDQEAIQAIQGLLVPQEDRGETRENQEKQANAANQAKTETLVLQDSLESKENRAFQVLQAGMGREDSKVNLDIQAHQER